MKSAVLFLSILLSLILGGRSSSSALSQGADSEYSLCQTPSSDNSSALSWNREVCISAVQGYSFSGDGGSNTVSFRVPGTGRRTSPQSRSLFRIVKGGKIIDNSHIHPFLAYSVPHLAGMYLPERYLFSICRLRL